MLLDRGQKVALVTDGRMSGASGKTPAALHVTPEAIDGGMLAYLRDGDIIRLDAEAGVLEVKVDHGELRRAHRRRRPGPAASASAANCSATCARAVGPADAGASVLF